MGPRAARPVSPGSVAAHPALPPVRSEPMRIGEWVIEPETNRVIGPDGPSRLENKIMRVLLLLASRPGRVVSKADLVREIWNGDSISDDVVWRAITEIRSVFQDDARNPWLVETVPRKGYRLIAGVGPVEPEAAPDERGRSSSMRRAVLWVSLAAAALLIAALLVWLPFKGRAAPLGTASLAPVPITSAPGWEFEPAFSPDGERVVYVGAESERSASLYIAAVETSAPHFRLTEDSFHDHSPVWSPDGRHIAFARHGTKDADGIYLIAAMGGAARQVVATDGAMVSEIDWSVDGACLYFGMEVDGSRPFAIHRSCLDDATATRISSPPAGSIGDRSLAVAPDGRIAFLRGLGSGVELRLIDPQRPQDESMIAGLTQPGHGLTWAANGHDLLWTDTGVGGARFWTVSTRGGPPRALGLLPAGAADAAISRDGELLAWTAFDFDYDIRVFDIAARTWRTVIDSTRLDIHPALDRDGRWIAFTSDRSGSRQLWTAAVDDDLVRQVTVDESSVWHPSWSADGRRIAYVARSGSEEQVRVVDEQSGSVTVLVSDGSTKRHPSWSRDGRWLYFGALLDEGWRVLRVSTTGGGEVTPASDLPATRALESPDGKWLFLSREEPFEIHRVPLSGGPAERLWSGSEAGCEDGWFPGMWDVSAQHLYLSECREGCELRRIDLVSGESELLTALESHAAAVSVSPGGELAAVTLSERTDADIMMLRGLPRLLDSM